MTSLDQSFNLILCIMSFLLRQAKRMHNMILRQDAPCLIPKQAPHDPTDNPLEPISVELDRRSLPDIDTTGPTGRISPQLNISKIRHERLQKTATFRPRHRPKAPISHLADTREFLKLRVRRNDLQQPIIVLRERVVAVEASRHANQIVTIILRKDALRRNMIPSLRVGIHAVDALLILKVLVHAEILSLPAGVAIVPQRARTTDTHILPDGPAACQTHGALREAMPPEPRAPWALRYISPL